MQNSLFASELTKNKNIRSLIKSYENNKLPAVVWGALDCVKPLIVSMLSDRKSSLIVVPEGSVDKVKKLLYPYFTDKIYQLNSRDFVFLDIEKLSNDDVHSRLKAIYKLSEAGNAVITTAEALMQFTASEEYFNSGIIYLEVGGTENFESFMKKLIDIGYTRTERVEKVGQFARRGDLFDIWCPLFDDPLRIEFFDDEIENISLFDSFTQRKKVKLDDCDIIPVSELNINACCRDKLDKETKELIDNGIIPNDIDRFIPAFYQNKTTPLDYLADKCNLFIFEHKSVFENAKTFAKRTDCDLKQLVSDGKKLIKGDYYLNIDELFNKFSKCKAIILDNISSGISEFNVKELITLNFAETSAWHGNLDILAEDVKFYTLRGYKIAICSANSLHSEKIKEYLSRELNNVKITCLKDFPNELPEGITVATAAVAGGFADSENSFVLFADSAVKGKTEKKPIKRIKNSKQITSVELLKKGDYVVHNDYGIGVFDSVVTNETDGYKRDMLKIFYAGSDVLYVPCDRLDLISKYTGADVASANIKLSKLGGTDWQNTKNKVRAAVKQLAFDLTALYAERHNSKGFAFSLDTLWQTEFEDSFQYVETDDQLRVIKEIKRDMEKPIAMDRLLCGDVGVGKTEVAMRAVFKCVSDGKQAAILVPTTVLALQHYRTFITRFADYPIKIEMLSRFVSEKERKSIIKRLKTGETDIVIGTHSLIQKKVEFKDLGLLIIDEEQRFGVGHKETLKEKYKNVDCLTLSATPIPRTLNMALSGIRDMSIIEDYPEDRQPVKTYLSEYDEDLVVDAVSKEVARGGQVYFLHNNIDSLYKIASKLSELLPDIRIDVAHGQMDEYSLSVAWDKLINKETDVLVCTTIIETGIDMPNVNTIIINNADKLGLAQLHQIRGRVGRSARRAYCYLLYGEGRVLTEDATKRLNAIREYSEFGSGLKIAIRDLELRGAGSVLGANQHGHIANVGYDMYLKLLENAVCEEKGIKPPPESCNIDIKVNAFISDGYISNVEDRIVIYKKISTLSDFEDSEELRDELQDRFGAIPDETEDLITVAEIRFSAENVGITSIKEEQNGDISFLFDNTDFELISKICASYGKDKINFKPSIKPKLIIPNPNKRKLKAIKELIELAVAYSD